MRTYLFTLAVLALLPMACSKTSKPEETSSKDPAQLILGKWYWADETMEFFPNGEFSYNKHRPGTFKSTYRLVDDETIEFQTVEGVRYVNHPDLGRTVTVTTTNHPQRRKIKVTEDELHIEEPGPDLGLGIPPNVKRWKRVRPGGEGEQKAQDAEPVYKGKSASYWAKRLAHTGGGERWQARQALEQMAPEARAAVLAEVKKALPELCVVVRPYICREGAAHAIGMLGPEAKEAVPALITAFSRLNAKEASEALVRIGPDAIPWLRKALTRGRGDRVKRMAAFTLGKLGPSARDAVPDLAAALEDKNVAHAAAEALGHIGGPEARNALTEASEDSDPNIRKAASRALRRIKEPK